MPDPHPRRRLLVALGAIALIVAIIWILEAGVALPFIGRSTGGKPPLTAADFTQSPGFVPFGAKGIKIGATGHQPLAIGKPAPDFTLLDMSGNPVKLSDLHGKTVALNFWATWCTSCLQEIPQLLAVSQQDSGRGLVVLGVDVQESPDGVRGFVAAHNMTYPIVLDGKGDVTAQYRLPGLPATFFVDENGILRASQIGVLTGNSLSTKLAAAGLDTAGGS